MSESLDNLFESGSVMLAAKEAGAGALLAALAVRAGPEARIVALAEPPADRYFADCGIKLPKIERHGTEWVPALDRVLAEYAPARIVVGASAGHTIEKDLIDAAQRRDIPAVCVVDHFWNLWQRFAGNTPDERWRCRPDIIFVPALWCRTRLVKLGCPVQDIRVFDHPLLAPALVRSPSARAKARGQLGWATDDGAILFVSEYGFERADDWKWDQPPDTDIEALGTELLVLATSLSREGRTVRLLIRPHPSEVRDWSKVLPRSPLLTIDRKLDKAEVLAAVDVAFGLNSMLLAEAAASGLPAYCRFPSQNYLGPKLSDFRPEVIELRSTQQCEAAVRRAIDL